MNPQPLHIQFREIAEMQQINNQFKHNKQPWAIQYNQKMPLQKGSCHT